MQQSTAKTWVSALLLGVLSFSAQAWDATGHIIVAQIAYDYLTPVARQDVDFLIEKTHFEKDFSKFSPYVYCASWPDYLGYSVESRDRNTKDVFNFFRILSKTWHYHDTPIVLGDYHPLSEGNSVWAVNNLVPQLASAIAKKDYNTAAYELAFLTHIVGDIHQPLHNASLYDNDFPRGDIGGNLYSIQPTLGPKNLHSAWDESLGHFSGWPGYSPNAGYHPPMNLLKETAIEFEALCSDDQASQVDPEAWSKEAGAIALDFVYPMHNVTAPKLGEALSESYVEKGQKIAAVQMCLAGKRLAAVLNNTLREPL